MSFRQKTVYQGENPMQNNLQLYHKILSQLCQWLPDERITRKRNLALLMTGLYLSASIHLSLIVRKWSVRSKLPSLVNRLHRFLKNKHLKPRVIYQPLAAHLIGTFARERLRLVIDVTKVGFNHRAMFVGMAYRRRTLPLAWSVHKGSRGNVSVIKVIELLEWVYQHIPYNCSVELVGDCGFRYSGLLHWLREREWHFVIRQPGETRVRLSSGQWLPLHTLSIKPGQTRVIGWVWIAKTNPLGPVWLVLHWARGEEEPWFLVSDRSPEHPTPLIRTYKRRMWMEEMFGDMKGHGFDLESTHLRHAKRIERLILGVCITFVWLISLGSWVVKNGHRHLIDVNSRRDKSYFRLGWDWTERCIHIGLPIRLYFSPYL
jgi:hypothetical protein